jgi:hypothetical protein
MDKRRAPGRHVSTRPILARAYCSWGRCKPGGHGRFNSSNGPTETPGHGSTFPEAARSTKRPRHGPGLRGHTQNGNLSPSARAPVRVPAPLFDNRLLWKASERLVVSLSSSMFRRSSLIGTRPSGWTAGCSSWPGPLCFCRRSANSCSAAPKALRRSRMNYLIVDAGAGFPVWPSPDATRPRRDPRRQGPRRPDHIESALRARLIVATALTGTFSCARSSTGRRPAVNHQTTNQLSWHGWAASSWCPGSWPPARSAGPSLRRLGDAGRGPFSWAVNRFVDLLSYSRWRP